jgi:hypothetical protein
MQTGSGPQGQVEASIGPWARAAAGGATEVASPRRGAWGPAAPLRHTRHGPDHTLLGKPAILRRLDMALALRRSWRMRTEKSPRYVICGWLLVTMLVLATSASGGERMRHSGSIYSVAHDGRTFVLAEVGPWQPRDGGTVILYRTITVTPDTEYVIVARADRGPNGFAGDFVELELRSDGIYLNDYITVDCRHEGKRLVALKITVVELPVAETVVGMGR